MQALSAAQLRQLSGSLCSSSVPTVPSCAAKSARRAYVYQNRRLQADVCHQRTTRLIARMGIRMIESFEALVELEEEPKAALLELLRNPTFCAQVATETKQAPGVELDFAEMLFQPVPWSPTTTKGMPQEYEKFHEDPAFVVINVPPNFLFQSKVFKPSRLCAFYKKK